MKIKQNTKRLAFYHRHMSCDSKTPAVMILRRDRIEPEQCILEFYSYRQT